MRYFLDEQLERLNVELIQMGSLCEDAIAASIKALFEGGQALIDETAALEAEIDHKERDIESLCLKILLQQQPVATDMRIVSSALKMISDMERIGDQAKDIAEISRHISKSKDFRYVKIDELAAATTKMVTDSIDAYVKKDLAEVKKVIASDDIVDNLFMEVRNELSAKLKNNTEHADLFLDLIMIAKYFERIGDHAVNIAEWVEYALTGFHKGKTI